MKTSFHYPKTTITAALILGLLALVAWSPPNNDMIVKVGWATTTDFRGFVAGDNGAVSSKIGSNTGYACVIGNGNEITSRHSLAAGASNTSHSVGSLIIGYDNYVGSPGGPNHPPAITANYSAAIGESNAVLAWRGWAMGYYNEVTGSRGVAIGSGATAKNNDSTALGRYNEEMATNDVLVVGSGSDNHNRFTALRVTADGGVVLGRAQGDISMGAYGH